MEPALDTSAEWIGDHDLYAILADVAAQQRDLDGIRRFANQAEALAVRYDHQFYLAVAHRAWGVAHRLSGEYEAAEARLRRSLAIFQAMETGWQIGRTRYEMGELAASMGEMALALARFADAARYFEKMDAAVDAAVVREAIALAENA